MTLSTPYSTVSHSRFYSMINKDDPQQIPDFYASNIENWLIRDTGELVMRPGLAARGSAAGATILGAGELRKAAGSFYLYRVLDGAADSAKFQYSTDGTTWTDVSGGGSKKTGVRWAMVQANNFVYAVNGTDTAVKLDGNTATTVAAIPKGTAIEWWKNHMFVLGVSATPDRLYFSNANDPETWGGSDFINVNLGDGSPGIGLKGHPGQSGRLYVGKENSVWYLTGTTSSDFAIAPLTYEHGVISHHSMIQVKNDVWCIDNEGNVRGLYRTTEDFPFSALRTEEIQATVAGLNKASLPNSSAIFYDNYAMFFVPNGVDSHNSLVMVYDTQANTNKSGNPQGGWILFTNWTIGFASIYDATEPKLYLHDSRDSNGQTYEWSGTSDNGVAITAKYETKIYDFGSSSREKLFKYSYQYAPVLGSVPFKFYSSINRFYYTLLKEFNLSGTGDALWGSATWGTSLWGSGGQVQQKVRYTDGGGSGKGYTLQVKLEATSSTTQVKAREFTIHYKFMGLR